MEDRSPENSGVHQLRIPRMSHFSRGNGPCLICQPARLYLTHRMGHRRHLDPSISRHVVHAHLSVPIFSLHLLRRLGFQSALSRLGDPGGMSHLPSSRPSVGLHYPGRLLRQPQSARPRYCDHQLGPRFRRCYAPDARAVGSANGDG